MKIMFLIRTLNYGGAERQLVVLAKELHKQGHSVGVAVFYPNGPLEKELHDAKVPVRVLEKKHRWDIFGFFLRLIKLLREEKPDILHGYLGGPNILTVMLKPFFPNVRMVWGVRASNMDLKQYDWFVRFAYWVECKLSRFADMIIVNSHAGRDYSVQQGFPKDKMVVIPNGIDTERFQPNSEFRKKIRNEWGVLENEKLIGLVARLDPMKDHATFLRAAALLLEERKDIHFVCVGDGPANYREKLYLLSKELGLSNYLIWAGARNDMSAVYNALDIASSSSLSEGFPNVIGEAMACGVSCVVTDVGDSAWLVGETGIVVDPKDPKALVEGWKSALAYNDKVVSQKSRNRIIESFSINHLVIATKNSFNQRFYNLK